MFQTVTTERSIQCEVLLHGALCDCTGCAPVKPTLSVSGEAAGQLEASHVLCLKEPLSQQPALLPIVYLHKMVSLKLMEGTGFKLS